MKQIIVPPYAPVLMEATRAIGYSLEAAVADIIDNSITAGTAKIDINFFPIGDSYVSILDNGVGMDEERIIEAMRYGGSRSSSEERDSTDLGRFGLGLKTASLSQCRRLTVVSKRKRRYIGAQWDLSLIAKTKKWSLKVLSSDDVMTYPGVEGLSVYDSGTLVIWQDLDRMMSGEVNVDTALGVKMDAVRDHLSLVFHRYLSGETGLKKMAITINGLPVMPADPFLVAKSTRIMDDETILVAGQKVIVRPYILPHLSTLSAKEVSVLGGKDGLRQQQGFYVYRNKRLLVGGTWFRMMRQGELSKLARVRVDIPNSLDHLWTLDIKKSTAVPPEAVRKNLGSIIDKIAAGSKRTWTYRGKKETDDSRIRIWNRFVTREGGVVYSLNRDHPLIEVYIRCPLPKDKYSSNCYFRLSGVYPSNNCS